MSDIELFQFPATGQHIRVVLRDGEPWFVAADACMALGIADPKSSVRLLDGDEKGVQSMHTPGGYQPMTLVSEAGLYSLILRSRRPEAKAFKRWVTHDVLPTIRRTGEYATARAHALPQSYAAALRELASTVEERDQARAELAEAAPKAEAWQVLASADGDYSVREAAFILNRDPAISTGQGRLFKTLHDFGVIDRRKRPYASHARHARLRPRDYTHPRTGETALGEPQVRITVEGLRYLHRRMGGAAPLNFQLEIPTP